KGRLRMLRLLNGAAGLTTVPPRATPGRPGRARKERSEGLDKRRSLCSDARPSRSARLKRPSDGRVAAAGSGNASLPARTRKAMPKMKTNRAAAKRFTKTGGGRFRRGKAGHSHGMISKNRKRNRRLRQNGI